MDARLTRRGLLQSGALVAGLGLVEPATVIAAPRRGPRPIPSGLSKGFKPVTHNPFIHVGPPGVGGEMATITDFHGLVGASEIRGTAHGSDGSAYDFDTDMRFMRGDYVGLDHRVHHGTFGFI